MVELTWYQNNNSASTTYKKWYVRPVMKQMLDIHEMSKHMAEHNTPFSAGTIEGILTDFVKCIREQLLNGNSVKIDNLGIFKISVQSKGFDNFAGIDPKTGKSTASARTGSAIRGVRMSTIGSGDFTREKLTLAAQFGWDTETQAKIEAEKDKIKAQLAEAEKIGEEVLEQQAGNTAEDDDSKQA